jgi:hypothetical protein
MRRTWLPDVIAVELEFRVGVVRMFKNVLQKAAWSKLRPRLNTLKKNEDRIPSEDNFV